MTAATRRAAYAWCADAINACVEAEGPWPLKQLSLSCEIARIRQALREASRVVDGPGVAGQDKTNTNGVR